MKKKVLIIDEDLAVCKEIKYALQSDTTDAYYVTSVQEGFELFTKQHFCLVIMDIILSEADGVGLLQAIRQTKPVPVLVLSSKAEKTNKVSALRAGVKQK
ncbi:response regulator [Clostridium transplantifaecale]|uniref:response regulator n=1 Tax=Clostridium transplantifaecale TaxID=2479838 RepID=UPI0013DE3290|nr:response regulator [Clostridium transplantifaecale]